MVIIFLSACNMQIQTINSLKDISLNPENYLNQSVTIKGVATFKDYGCSYDYKWITMGLVDNEGYLVYFYPKGTRAFEYGKTYTISGKLVKVVTSGGENTCYLVVE